MLLALCLDDKFTSLSLSYSMKWDNTTKLTVVWKGLERM